MDVVDIGPSPSTITTSNNDTYNNAATITNGTYNNAAITVEAPRTDSEFFWLHG